MTDVKCNWIRGLQVPFSLTVGEAGNNPQLTIWMSVMLAPQSVKRARWMIVLLDSLSDYCDQKYFRQAGDANDNVGENKCCSRWARQHLNAANHATNLVTAGFIGSVLG